VKLRIAGLSGELTCIREDSFTFSAFRTFTLADGDVFNLVGINTTAFTVIQSTSGQTCGTSASFCGPLTAEKGLKIKATGRRLT
jgi:hypothetical protein